MELQRANPDQYCVTSTKNDASYVFIVAASAVNCRIRVETAQDDAKQENGKEVTGRQRRFVLSESTGPVTIDNDEPRRSL